MKKRGIRFDCKREIRVSLEGGMGSFWGRKGPMVLKRGGTQKGKIPFTV